MLDVLIIGGGPAGAAAAIELRKRGHAVLLLEQRRFPRDKVCGECLSSLGIGVLERLGVAEPLRQLHPRQLRHAVLYARDGRACELQLPQPMWGLSRRALDAALLSAARDAGTQILQPARCEAVEGGAVPTATVRDLSDNSVRRVEARWIVLADGKGGPHHPAASGDLGVKAHFQNVRMADDAIELFGLPGHYGGLAPIEDGFNAAFSVPAARLTSYAGNMDALMEHVIRQNVALHRRLAGAVRVGRWVVSPLPRFAVRRAWSIGVVPIGNAAAALEPVGGEGMGLALRSGEMAAVAIDAALRGGAAVGRDLAMRFDRLWRQRRFFCRALALALSHPTAARMIVALGRGGVGPRLALAALGKPCPSTRFATAVL